MNLRLSSTCCTCFSQNLLLSDNDPRDWREKQQEEIRARDAESKVRREETIDKAERAIEEFYENYAKKKERSIRDNKYAPALYEIFLRFMSVYSLSVETRNPSTLLNSKHRCHLERPGSASVTSSNSKTHKARVLHEQARVRLICRGSRRFC
jgi:hypothetical protein